MTTTTTECAKCGLPFELVPFRLPGGGSITRTNPCLHANGKLLDYCSQECFRDRNVEDVDDCWGCDMVNPSEFHVGRVSEVPDELRCPGCCGPVYRNNFCSPDEAQRFVAYTCGTDSFHIGAHGSLAYIRSGDTRSLQVALDEEFGKRQNQRDEIRARYDAGERSLGRRDCWGGLIISHFVPNGRLPATSHGVDCKCVKPVD